MFFICTLNSFSQVELKGKVIDFITYLPLENTSVYVDRSTIGSVSNRDGKFILSVPKRLQNDTLVISSIGYKSYKVLVNDFINDAAIFLETGGGESPSPEPGDNCCTKSLQKTS